MALDKVEIYPAAAISGALVPEILGMVAPVKVGDLKSIPESLRSTDRITGAILGIVGIGLGAAGMKGRGPLKRDTRGQNALLVLGSTALGVTITKMVRLPLAKKLVKQSKTTAVVVSPDAMRSGYVEINPDMGLAQGEEQEHYKYTWGG